MKHLIFTIFLFLVIGCGSTSPQPATDIPRVQNLDYVCQRQSNAYICDNEKTGDRLDIVILNNGDGTYKLTGLLVKGLSND